ncbi:hypothetical protein [Pseudomonas serbica]|jgi:hypothetical protein|uniref:hypothetical protein n=1 Tax=Pseudomonas serbica TaxID=2965074 RepID=UPI00237A6EBD|nr:hypothetical protein [Pseudomonas serbica]
MVALDAAIAMVFILLAIKILACIWACVFVYYTVLVFVEDGKFGRYCWQISLLCGLFYSTGLPIILIFDAIENPKAPFSRLKYLRKSSRR